MTGPMPAFERFSHLLQMDEEVLSNGDMRCKVGDENEVRIA
jgi:hypothetical protein